MTPSPILRLCLAALAALAAAPAQTRTGVDVLAADRLGRLALTLEGVAERDRRVVAAARRAGLPMAWVLGGGYAEPIALSVRAHVNTYRALCSAPCHGRQEERSDR